MEKCSKCESAISDNDVMAWKCMECGKAFKVNLSKLKKLQVLKNKPENTGKMLLKCPTCGNGIDNGNEKIACKCSACGNVMMGNLRDFAFFNREGVIKNNTINIDAYTHNTTLNDYTYITNNNHFQANINTTGNNINNLIIMAKNAQEMKNYEEANIYYTRILEIQPTNCDALVGKGVSALYNSNLNNIKADELIGYIDKAIECKKIDQDKQSVNEFIISSANALYNAAITVFQASKNHYNEFWKLESSAPEYWDRLGKVIKIFLFVITLTEDENIRNLENGTAYYIESIKFVVLCCVEICKQRQYVSGIVNPGQLLEMEEKREIKPIPSIHETYLLLYDNMIQKIKELDPTYIPEEINRNKQIKGACYIATCVYGSYDCPQVWTLRRYRDYTLNKTWYGRIFIKFYYTISPILVKQFGKTNWFKKLWKPILDKLVSNLNANGIDSLIYYD